MTELINAVNIDAIQFEAQATDPDTPVTGYGRLFMRDSDNKLFFEDESGNVYDLTSGAAPDYIELRHTETSGTNDQTLTSATWNTRTINEETVDAGGHCALSSNQFTLSAGTYQFVVTDTHGSNADDVLLRLYNDTDASVIAYSTGMKGLGIQIAFQGQFTIAAGKALELQIITDTTSAGPALDISGIGEVYTVISLWKVG